MENFQLSEHIAGCNLTLLDTDVTSCDATGTIGDATLDNPGYSWFVPSNNLCEAKVQDYCYTNGTTTIATINS